LMAQVILEKVSKIYPGGMKAVDEIDLSIRDQEFIVLVGPSGCGKSTTLRMVAGLEEISGGQIRIGERVVNNLPPGDRDIAMVFQNYALYPHMTVAENIGFALRMRKVPKAEARLRIEETARIIGLVDHLDRKPGQQFGAPQRLYEGPANLFVASFIGSPAMNMLEGSLERRADDLVCRIGTAALTLPPEVLDARPTLERHLGRPIAVGIRPEALDEPGRRDGGDGGLLRGRVQAVEALGPEQLAHVEIDAKPVLVEDVLEGLVDAEAAEDLAEIKTETDADGSRATVVARLDASAKIRPDEPIELAVDLRRLHFFDIGSGEAI